jgi:hypothetical protein
MTQAQIREFKVELLDDITSSRTSLSPTRTPSGGRSRPSSLSWRKKLAKRGSQGRAGNSYGGRQAQDDGGMISSGRVDGNEGAHGAPQADVLGDFAADLGKFLGSVQNRATTWLDQRKAIADQLTQIRDTANEYLQQLKGDHVPFLYKEGKRRGRPPGSGTAKSTRPPGSADAPAPGAVTGRRTMSAAARKRISDAQKARWAKQRGK